MSTTTTKTEATERKAPDKSKEAKLDRALSALNSAATAYFNEGDTDTALELRKLHDAAAKLSTEKE